MGLAFKWLETKSATVNLFADKASKWGPYYTAEQINEALDEVMLGECITIVGFLEVRAAAKINEQIRNVIFSKQFKFDLQFFANKGAGKTTKLYRVMSEGEYNSLMKNGQFIEYDKAMDSKWFATNAKDAAEWGKKFYPNENYKMVEIEVPKDSLSQMYYVEKLDSIGPAYCAERDIINSIIKSIKDVIR